MYASATVELLEDITDHRIALVQSAAAKPIKRRSVDQVDQSIGHSAAELARCLNH